MIQLNTINLTTDLRLGMNGGTVLNRSKQTAFGGYALKDLVLQLDVGKGLNGRKWLDLISKTEEATITGPFTTEDGIVLESGAKVVMPVVDNIAYVEIAKR